MLRKLLFQMAKGPLMGKAVGKAFQHCSWMIPVKYVYRGRDILAFEHPKPAYPNHLILTPQMAVRHLLQEEFAPFFGAIWEVARKICAAHPEYHASFTLVANGGKRQEVQQVHFHLFTNHEMVNTYSAQEQAQNVFYRDRDICVLEHPAPDWETHFVICPASPMDGSEAAQAAYFEGVLRGLGLLNEAFHLAQNGYSLLYRHDHDMESPMFHVISGRKR